ncbi:MAG: hypothetical protein WED81_04170 [Rhodothermales bacterium]
MRRFLLIGALLALLLPLTWLARTVYVAHVEKTASSRQRNAVTEALEEIEARFNEMQSHLMDRAEALAESQTVIRGLRIRSRSGLAEGPQELVDYFAELHLPNQNSVELYDSGPELVAWNGFSMPVDAAPESTQFLESFQTAIAMDQRSRQALVVWWPVREGTSALGAVRVMELIGYDAPVQNEYLRDISLADRWKRLTHLPVDVSFEPSGGADSSQRSRLLQGADGSVLGRVIVEPPERDFVVRAAGRRFNDVLAFWMVLFLGWLVGGVWYLYRRLPRAHLLSRAMMLGGVSILWWGIRFTLLKMDVPARWQQGKSPLSPIFDPIHFASDLGGGLMRSSGDFLLTSIFFLLFAAAVAELALAFRQRNERFQHVRLRLRSWPPASMAASLGSVAAGAVVVVGLMLLVSVAARRVVLDSTFDFFARKGLLPEPLLLVIFGSMILFTVAVLLISSAVVWISLSAPLRKWPENASPWLFWLLVLPTVLITSAVL